MRISRNLSAGNNLVFGFLIVAGFVATYLALEFGSLLGFNFGGPFFFALLILVFFAVFAVLSLPRLAAHLTGSHSPREPIVILFLLSVLIRVWFAFNSSILPDEYSFLGILQTHPLGNIPYFLLNYQSVAGGEAIHPPLPVLLMSIGYEIYPSITSARLVSSLFSMATIFLVYKIANEFEFKRSSFLLTALFAFMPLSVIFSVTALTDVYALFFGLGAVLAFMRGLRGANHRWLIFSGLLLGASLWSKFGIPVFWAFVIVLLSLFMRFERPKMHSISRGMIVIALGFGTYALWGVINPSAFTAHNLFSYVIRPPNVTGSGVGLGSPNIPAPLVGETNPVLRFMYSLFPGLVSSSGTVSVSELLLQIPLWLSPSASLLWAIALLKSYGNSRRSRVLAVWSMVPFLVMVPFIRDVRYLLPAVFGIAALVANLIERNPQATRRLGAVTFAFIAIFLVILTPVTQQEYYGVTQASSELDELGLSHARILTNAPQIALFLPNAQVSAISPDYNDSSLMQLVISQHPDAIVLIHNARAAWPIIDNSTSQQLTSMYPNRVKMGPSTFSWFEIDY